MQKKKITKSPLFTKFKRTFPDLYYWLTSSVGSHHLEELIRIDTMDDDFCSFSFQTSSYEYHISAFLPSSESMAGSLAGIIMNKAGPSGSNDIGGGPYSFLTWVDILKDILRYEPIPLSKEI